MPSETDAEKEPKVVNQHYLRYNKDPSIAGDGLIWQSKGYV
jgi:hypothetical protein